MNCQVPHCPVVAWKHGLCRDHWMANARNEPTGLPTPGLPAWARPAPALAKDSSATATTTAPPPPRDPRPRARAHEQPPRPAAPPKPAPAQCAEPGCDRRVVCKGRCAKHDAQRRAAEKRAAVAALEAQRARQVPPPAPLTGAALEPAALRLVWSCVPQHGAQLHEVADACGLGLRATVTALHALETTYGYVTFDGAYWHALIPCGRQRGATP